MEKNEIENKINSILMERRSKVVAHHAIKALLGIFTDPVGSLGKLFIEKKNAMEEEKHKIEQDIILDLLCKIDSAIEEAIEKTKGSLKSTVVVGEIIASGKNVKDVTGVEISEGSGTVEFKPGTQIKAEGENVDKVTGLKIGDKK